MAAPPGRRASPVLPDELVEEILLRLPPDDPACLLRASAVCKTWGCAIISHPTFRRRLHEHHRIPPVLGFLHDSKDEGISNFVPTTESAFYLAAPDRRIWRALDCRHGRAIFLSNSNNKTRLLVWEPITGAQQLVRVPLSFENMDPGMMIYPSAAVLCAAAGCDHHGCHGGPFSIVFVFTMDNTDEDDDNESFLTSVCVYSSDTGTWGEPISKELDFMMDFGEFSPVLVRSSILYFMHDGFSIIECDLARKELDVIDKPEGDSGFLLMVTEKGGLGLIQYLDSQLMFWSRMETGDEEWVLSRVLSLQSLLPIDSLVNASDNTSNNIFVLGFAEGANIIFVNTVVGMFSIDIMSGRVSRVCGNGFGQLIPVVAFYTPVPQNRHHDQPMLNARGQARSSPGIRMGNCFSGDVRGGKEAVGGGGSGGANEAVDHFFQGHALHGLYTPLELSFSAAKLRNMDALSKSDPILVIYTKKDGRLEEIGRTEVILNSLEPSWITKATINYHFEMVQPLVFRIYDVDTKYHNTPVKMLNLAQQDFLGEAYCNLSEIVTKFNNSHTLNLRSGSGHALLSTLTVHAEETSSSRMAVEMTFHCVNLDNKDTFSLSDPFLRVSRVSETAAAVPICKTEVVMNNLNPVWRPVTLTSQQFSSKDNPLLVECFDFDDSGNHELIGSLQTTISQLENIYNSKIGANFYSNKGQKKLKGQLFLDKFQEKVQHTFLDYISSGFELNFMVAVDYTASNGDPRIPQSLHYIDPSGRPNAYQQAILGVSEVLQFYDSDRRFPAWGFGAKIPQGFTSHCFNLNATTNDCEVVGVEGIMSAYSSTLYSVSLSGPTLFGPVINKAAEIANHAVQYSNNKYFVLLIITDGVNTDVQETKDAIVRASDLPLSILIVGVGDADFTQMRVLDADFGKRLESSTGRVATRDIVQFVPVKEVQGGTVTVVQSLLEELPGQFLEYMRTRDIKPCPPQQASAPAAYAPPPML